MVSKGSVDVAALTSASVEATDYVPPADRYAVVPGAAPNADSLEVPQVLAYCELYCVQVHGQRFIARVVQKLRTCRSQ